jgi:hypothetical protein
MWISMDTDVYTWVYLRKGTYTSKSMSNLGRIAEQILLGLFVVVFLSVGHYPYYGSPDFIIIKSSQY